VEGLKDVTKLIVVFRSFSKADFEWLVSKYYNCALAITEGCASRQWGILQQLISKLCTIFTGDKMKQ